MNYPFSGRDKDAVVKHFGLAFMGKVERLIEPLSERWALEKLNLVQSFSANLVFEGVSTRHGSVMLKFGTDEAEFRSEVQALDYFKSKPVCQLIDIDYENTVMLLEAIEPGKTLQSEIHLEKRLEVFTELYKNLHWDDAPMVKDVLERQSYSDWIAKITDYMHKESEWREVAVHMERARSMYLKLTEDFTTVHLLHGDFHYYNILEGQDGYKMIDPKGVVGDPIFDIPRYVLNEFCDEKNRDKVDDLVQKIMVYLSRELDISKAVLRELLYIEGTMAMCWCVESGMPIDEKNDVLKMLSKLYGYTKRADTPII